MSRIIHRLALHLALYGPFSALALKCLLANHCRVRRCGQSSVRERMSSTTSTCSSECVQSTCAKDSALSIDQCWSICLLHCRYDSDGDRHAAYLFNLQARKACQSHAQQQRKLLQRYRSVYVYLEATVSFGACLHHTWPHLSHYTNALHLHVPTSGSTLPSYFVAHRACLLTLLMSADQFVMHVTGSNKKHTAC